MIEGELKEPISNLITYSIRNRAHLNWWISDMVKLAPFDIDANLKQLLMATAGKVFDYPRADGLVTTCLGSRGKVDMTVLLGRSYWLSEAEAYGELGKLQTVLKTRFPSEGEGRIGSTGLHIVDDRLVCFNMLAQKATYSPEALIQAVFFDRPYAAGDVDYARKLGLY